MLNKQMICLIMCLSCCLSSGAEECKQTVKVGAWNIQWLGNPKERKAPTQKPEDIASYIEKSSVDILALSEISKANYSEKDPAKFKNNQLDEAFGILNASGALWKYRLFAKRPGARAPNDQLTGIAWNEKKVQIKGGPWPLPVKVDAKKENDIKAKLRNPQAITDTIILSRWPNAIKFSAGANLTDWLIVPVHLKSNTDGPFTAEARSYEANLILDGLKSLTEKDPDKDIVILGDTNMLASSESGVSVFESAGYTDCNHSDMGTWGTKPFDRIFIPKTRPSSVTSCQNKSANSDPLGFKVFTEKEWRPEIKKYQFKERLSDHLLVSTSLCVLSDDD